MAYVYSTHMETNSHPLAPVVAAAIAHHHAVNRRYDLITYALCALSASLAVLAITLSGWGV